MSSGSKYKDIMKKGWHPEKPGTTFKGQVVSRPSPLLSLSPPLLTRYPPQRMASSIGKNPTTTAPITSPCLSPGSRTRHPLRHRQSVPALVLRLRRLLRGRERSSPLRPSTWIRGHPLLRNLSMLSRRKKRNPSRAGRTVQTPQALRRIISPSRRAGGTVLMDDLRSRRRISLPWRPLEEEDLRLPAYRPVYHQEPTRAVQSRLALQAQLPRATLSSTKEL